MTLFKRTLALICAAILSFSTIGGTVAQAKSAQSAKANYVTSNRMVVKNQSFDAMAMYIDEDVEAVKASYLTPSGQVVTLDGDHVENTDQFLFTIKPAEKGRYQLKSLEIQEGGSLKALDIQDFQGDFEVVDTMSEIYGKNGPLIDASYLYDGIRLHSDGFNAVANAIRAYDAKGRALEVQVEIDGPASTSYRVLNEGFARTSTQDLAPTWQAGTYSLEFTAEGCEPVRLTVEVLDQDQVADQAYRNGARLAALDFTYRVAGLNRYETAVSISDVSYERADNAFLVNSDNFADALTASSLAMALKGPILYVDQNEMPVQTLAEMEQLGVKNVYVIGGPVRISDQLVNGLKANYKVQRIAGSNRYKTATAVADLLRKQTQSSAVIITNASSQTDALIAAPYSAMKGIPMLFADPQALDPVTHQYLKEKGFTEAILVGNEKQMSASVVKELESLGIVSDRVTGSDRFETAVNFAKTYMPNSKRVVLTSGGDKVLVDALASGPMAGLKEAPLLFTETEVIPSVVRDYLQTLPLDFAYVAGGSRTVANAVRDDLDALILKKNTVVPSTVPSANAEPAETVIEQEAEKPEPEKVNQDMVFDGDYSIMLDAGHGWNYNQGIIKSYFEGEAMLKLAYYLREELLTYGFKVGMTRKRLDGSIGTPQQAIADEQNWAKANGRSSINNQIHSLPSRGQRAKGYDVFISLHSNSANASVTGSEVFDDTGTPNNALAKKMVTTVANYFGHTNRGVKYAYNDDGKNAYIVLRNNEAVSGMLLEHGFHSNQSDCSKLHDDDFLRGLAKAEAQALAEYFKLR